MSGVTPPGALYQVDVRDKAGGEKQQLFGLDLGDANNDLPWAALIAPPDNEAPAPPVRAVGQAVWNCSFSESGASILSPQMTPKAGAMTNAQASGALTITMGTAANAEWLSRSLQSWRGSLRMRASVVMSQRIANNNVELLLADLVGENLAVTVLSATSITISQAGHPFTAESVGQFVMVGGITGIAGAVPGRYAISAVTPGINYTLTVAGWPASGSGTATVFGHSYCRTLFTGTTATSHSIQTQRRGWAEAAVAATCNSTASPGTIVQTEMTGRDAVFSDFLRVSATAPNITTRGIRYENLPDDNLDLYLFVWAYNGTTAPASSTTFTCSFLAVEKFANQPVYVQGFRGLGDYNPLPVRFPAIPAFTLSGTGNSVQGPAAQAAAVAGNPFPVALDARTASPTAVATGQVARAIGTVLGVQITKPYAIPELAWNANVALTTTTATALVAAGGAGLKRHITGLQAINTGTAVDLIILDGATERWRLTLPQNVPVSINFPTELLTTAATALNANLSAAGTVRVCAQGYTAP